MIKSTMVKIFDHVANRAVLGVNKQIPLFKVCKDAFNIEEVAQLKAAYESAELYEQEFLAAARFADDLSLLTEAVQIAKSDGLFLEFGVATGRSMRHVASLHAGQIYGFDSFEGLPEAWRTGYDKGAFAQALPEVPGNVTLVKGWFNETLAPFMKNNAGSLSFLHVDCDLYSSTKTIFAEVADRIIPGTVIVFDEFWNYPGWKHHEYKAFEELKADLKIVCEPFGFVPTHQQVGFVVKSVGG